MDLPPLHACQALIELHVRLGEVAGAQELDAAHQLLAMHRLQWSDWPEFFALTKKPPVAMPNKQRRGFCGLHALMGRASTETQRKHARNVLIRRLAENSFSWSSDLPAILAADWLDQNPISSPGTTSGSDTKMALTSMSLILADS